MSKFYLIILFCTNILIIFCCSTLSADDAQLSEKSEMCLDCHRLIHPGIVKSWQGSAHARRTPAQANEVTGLQRKVSFLNEFEQLPGKNYVVGCAECHTLSPQKHPDSFNHEDFQVHTVVSSNDCMVCHNIEGQQYSRNIMSHAYGNLANNELYQDLINQVSDINQFEGQTLILKQSDVKNLDQACYDCHGTKITVASSRTIESDLGEMEIPVLTGWPNQGVGRINPDSSLGCCSACHSRHGFSLEVARKPQTCATCHKGPDVPAYKVYNVSKHGTVYSNTQDSWDFDNVPWVVGRDFKAPTCATCHIGLVVDTEGEVICKRTHQMNDRLSWRIFGLVYAHPHPISPDTSEIRNKAGLPLPTNLNGQYVSEKLINNEQQKTRRKIMQKLCLSCHSTQWVSGHFTRLDEAIQDTNKSTLTATKILEKAWKTGMAKGLENQNSIFDEAIEKKWVEHWLFYANSIRFSAAMVGADYGVFANGRWFLSKNVVEMFNMLNSMDGEK